MILLAGVFLCAGCIPKFCTSHCVLIIPQIVNGYRRGLQDTKVIMVAIFWIFVSIVINKWGVKLFAFKSLVTFDPTVYLVCLLVYLDSTAILYNRLQWYNWEYFAYINTSISGQFKYNILTFELILAWYLLNCLWHTWACAWRTWTTVCDGHLSTEPSWGPVICKYW